MLASGLVALGCAGLWQLRSPSARRDEPAVRLERGSRGLHSREAPRHLSALALLRTPPEGLPSTVIRALGHAQPGLNASLAQRVPENVPGRYWVVPGRGFLCMVWLRGSTSTANTVCGTTPQVETYGLAGVSLREGKGPGSGERLIVGIAPGSARRVRIETTGWPTTTSAVGRYGVFAQRDSVLDPPTRIVSGAGREQLGPGH